MGLSREPGLATRLTADTHITLFNNAGALGFFFLGWVWDSFNSWEKAAFFFFFFFFMFWPGLILWFCAFSF